MSPELGFLLFAALLWGPTALWILYRAALSPRNRNPNTLDTGIAADQSQPAPTAALDFERFWACESCRSVNRRETKRCYSCRAERGAPPRGAVEEPAVPTWVPVMAERIAQSPSTDGEPVAATVTAATARTPAVQDPLPPAAAVLATSPAPRTPVDPRPPVHAVATDSPAAPTVAPLVAVAVSAAPAASVAGVTTFEPTRAHPESLAGVTATAPVPPRHATVPPVCPFLGLRADPSTRLDYADSRNVCHAGAARDSGAERRRRAIARPRSGKVQAIGLDHQASHCLAAAHRACALYPAVETVQPSR